VAFNPKFDRLADAFDVADARADWRDVVSHAPGRAIAGGPPILIEARVGHPPNPLVKPQSSSDRR
jgi:thiamine pyrophosphate-dependent acetolactate synthase large subunit-like protein